MKKAKLQQISLFDFDETPVPAADANIPADIPVTESEEKTDTIITINTDPIPVEPFVLAKPEKIILEEPEQKLAPSIERKKNKPADIKPKSTRGRKSMKEMIASVDLVQVPEDEILFQKSYYSIGKVAEMFQVNQSLIRLWEREFDVLKPKKNAKGDRFFRPEDIKNIQLIHHLTRAQKYTMEGAKEYFKNNKKAEEKFATIESLKKIKSFLLELNAHL